MALHGRALENKRTLLGAITDDNRPLATKLQYFLAETQKIFDQEKADNSLIPIQAPQ